jgi:hypothetical protein
MSIVGLPFFYVSSIQSASVVYNLRISETTKRQVRDKKYMHPRVLAVTLFDQFRKTHTETHDHIGGGLGTFIYARELFYARVEFAAAHVRSYNNTIDYHYSRTQTDDVLLTAGYSHILSKKTRMTFTGLVGIPTHRDTVLQGFEFGTGHVGIGAQFDSSYIYAQSLKNSHVLMGAARIIHFFPRTVFYTITDVTTAYRYNIGNLADLFISSSNTWGNHHTEVGYNPTFAFSASIHPDLDDVVKQTNFIRSSFYGTYQYGFLLNNALPIAVTFGISYGFDHRPKLYGNKYVVTAWISLGTTV